MVVSFPKSPSNSGLGIIGKFCLDEWWARWFPSSMFFFNGDGLGSGMFNMISKISIYLKTLWSSLFSFLLFPKQFILPYCYDQPLIILRRYNSVLRNSLQTKQHLSKQPCTTPQTNMLQMEQIGVRWVCSPKWSSSPLNLDEIWNHKLLPKSRHFRFIFEGWWKSCSIHPDWTRCKFEVGIGLLPAIYHFVEHGSFYKIPWHGLI